MDIIHSEVSQYWKGIEKQSRITYMSYGIDDTIDLFSHILKILHIAFHRNEIYLYSHPRCMPVSISPFSAHIRYSWPFCCSLFLQV